MRPLGRVKIKWSPEFAYAIGLLVTDGSLSKDGRHIDFTSKDREQLRNFMSCLGIKVKIGKKISGFTKKMVTHIQFGDVNFYRFLLAIGFMPAKSKIISGIKIPKKYFFDFLRGHFDGDGSFYSYFDPRWRSSFMFYTVFISASFKHVTWLRKKITKLLNISGHLTKSGPVYQLKFAKAESRRLLQKMYKDDRISLSRKKKKVEKALKLEADNFARVL